MVCDRGYSSDPWRGAIRAVVAEPGLSPNPMQRDAPRHDRSAYRRRHRIENLWERLKEWRDVATRFDKTSASILGAIHPAAALDWIPNGP
jgi:transposase